ncbi:MAG: ATP-dependent Clp protease proteolytic subunit [Clostridia bacterium]|nr:ATP-dependent Clp protease proteolytic subunit [Clostridia bacterium]
MLIPYVIDQVNGGERSYDIYSRLLEDRIIFIGGEITNEVANTVICELLYLEAKDNTKDISIYINSNGGVIDAGMAIIDTMKYIKCRVRTICVGLCASMAAVILSAGEKKFRYSLPHSRIMIHQPLGGVQGKASDMEIACEEILKAKKMINGLLSENTQKSIEQIENDTQKDFYMTANEAKKYGIIDKVLTKNE